MLLFHPTKYHAPTLIPKIQTLDVADGLLAAVLCRVLSLSGSWMKKADIIGFPTTVTLTGGLA
jgi:hypothetical protein